MYKLSNPRFKVKITTELAIMAFFLVLSHAVIESFFSIYLKEAFNLSTSKIGLLTFLLTLLSFVFSFFSEIIIGKFHEKKTLVMSLVFLVIINLMIFFNTYIVVFLILISLFNFFHVLRITSFHIMFRDNSKDEEISEDEGLLFSLIDLAWFLAPLISGFLIITYSIRNIFLLGAFASIIGILMFLSLTINDDSKKSNNSKTIKETFQNLKKFASDDFYLNAYVVASVINIWWALMYIFIPIMIYEEGLGKIVIGTFLSLLPLPVIILEYRLTKVIKKIGFKKGYLYGYLIIIVCAFMAFLVNNYYLKIGFLIAASVGAAFIGPARDAYFFKHTTKSKEEIYFPFYNTHYYFGSLLGKMFFSLFFIFIVNTNLIFLFVALILISFIPFILKIKDQY